MPSFRAPKDTVLERPTFIKWPRGTYHGDVTQFQLGEPINGSKPTNRDYTYQFMNVTIENPATTNGEVEVVTPAGTFQLEGQTRRFSLLLDSTDEKAMARAVEQVLKFAAAIGVATEEDGNLTLPGDPSTAEEVHEVLSAGEGQRVAFSIKHTTRTDASGVKQTFAEAGSVWPIED